jgi:formylglycine-generating enzyme required for sulfatase activity
MHQVTISNPVYMQTTEVTQGQWQRVMGSNPSRFKDCGGDCPVEQVSWDDVQEFIRKLNGLERTDKYRLPTEAQWEYAARSGGKKEEWAGTSNESSLESYAWYDANSGGKTHPVARKQPNGLGLFDMSGNVWEWVQDWYGNYPAGSVTDPEGPSSGSYRVVRGGSWFSDAGYCRSAYRGVIVPGDRNGSLGFRLLRTR